MMLDVSCGERLMKSRRRSPLGSAVASVAMACVLAGSLVWASPARASQHPPAGDQQPRTEDTPTAPSSPERMLVTAESADPEMRSTAGVATGRDLIACLLPETGPFKWGASGDIMAYSISNYSGNNGTADIEWEYGTPWIPIDPQNFYRLKDGRMEHIGMSWCKHGFCALQLSGSCVSGCAGEGGCLDYLAPGCMDASTGSAGGSTSTTMSPHWQVNAWTGQFVYPPAAADPAVPSVIRRRIQVHASDLDPALNAGALYFGELVFVHQGDAHDGNHYNNASYRQFTVGALTGGAYTLTWAPGSSTQVMEPAVAAWQAADAGVARTIIDIPGEGRLLLYYKASNNGDGTWHYEYAMHNVNSDRSAGRFSIPVPPGVQVSNVGFHDVDYHSGEPYSLTDWPGRSANGSLTWETDDYAVSSNANALRWATTYNFRFDADTPPTDVQALVGIFKPGTPDEVQAATVGPSTSACPQDLDGDGQVGAADLAVLLGGWGAGAGHAGDFDQDGVVGPPDLAVLLGHWGEC